MRPSLKAVMEYSCVTFSPAESRHLDELLEDLRQVDHPDMDLATLVDAIYIRALEDVERGSLDAEEMRAMVTEIIAEDIIDRRAKDLPEHPTPDDVIPLAIELGQRLDRLTKDDHSSCRKVLAEVSAIVTPDTIMAWHEVDRQAEGLQLEEKAGTTTRGVHGSQPRTCSRWKRQRNS